MNEDFYAKSSRLGKVYWDFYQKCERYTDTIKETERIQEAILQLEESKKS